MSTPFGPVFNFAKVERWLLETAETWFPTYLAEAERQSDEEPHTFAPVENFIVANEWDSWPEEHLPCLLVMDTGVGDQPKRDGGGRWSVRRIFGASIIVQAPTRTDVRWASGLYGAAFRSLLLQHQDLGHPESIGGVDWTDERPAPVPTDDERNIGAQISLFIVDIKDVADEGGVPRGPQFPADPPPPEPYTPPEDLPVIDPPLPGESRITIRTRKVGQ
jgi:hypothetical protein